MSPDQLRKALLAAPIDTTLYTFDNVEVAIKLSEEIESETGVEIHINRYLQGWGLTIGIDILNAIKLVNAYQAVRQNSSREVFRWNLDIHGVKATVTISAFIGI